MGEFNNRRELKDVRKELRNPATAAEATLWIHLKNSQLDGRKFRRQHSFGTSIIVDFYCPGERLVIELDGAYHFDPIGVGNDMVRDEFLAGHGIRVLRFENKEVFEDIEHVLEAIRKKFKKG